MASLEFNFSHLLITRPFQK